MKITKDYLRELIKENLQLSTVQEASAPIMDFRQAKIVAFKLGKILSREEVEILKTVLLSNNSDYLRSFANALSVGAAGKK